MDLFKCVEIFLSLCDSCDIFQFQIIRDSANIKWLFEDDESPMEKHILSISMEPHLDDDITIQVYLTVWVDDTDPVNVGP